ncbi:CHAT domain-containing protein [Pseudomonas canadensis]|uniref:CHAT domain-containing protein n=1 Tax=Pseudomonas canadensis TaxID=915099 RepID=UPI00289354D7|nr:CHAT domain-containing protein [Pseudomonas canadensis]WNJ82661.1 CHAT domain-containing protein [Pseudomonas canadensis]
MAIQFNLLVSANPATGIVDLNLQDEKGAQLAFNQLDIRAMNVNERRKIFDLGNYLERYVSENAHAAAVADVGVAIGHQLLGTQILDHIEKGNHRRTLCVYLPALSMAEGIPVAALARVPWEIARRTAKDATLGERNLLVRVNHSINHPPSKPIPLKPDEALRVLFVFAEARGARPLSARKERRELLELFKRDVYPHRRIVAHFLTHGVTRARLIDQIEQHSGYHVVHWSGHGSLNVLDLASPGGANDAISGDELVTLFNDAGGFLPRLIFLSACQSGDSLQPRDWYDFFSIVQGQARVPLNGDEQDEEDATTAAGTAYALLNSGVPSVVAMRYAVSDDYARALAVRFYSALLADPAPKDAADALNRARKHLAAQPRSDTAFSISDHATAMLYGEEQPGLSLLKGKSPDDYVKDPRLQQISELSSANHEHFVGRTWELADLGADFIGSRDGEEVKPVAIVIGLGGMGKTALVAEAIDLWANRFDWVLQFQAKPAALNFEATMLEIHLKLFGELGSYYHHVTEHPADQIFRDAEPGFTGTIRVDRLVQNLVRALQHESILFVLDNFEANLKPHAESGEEQVVWACQDPAWDKCLKSLAAGLVRSRSRLLVTSRLPLQALPNDRAFVVLLGPLPPAEAALYLRAHPALSLMAMGGDEKKRSLAIRLLKASRFHPLLMDRLTRLAADEKLHGQLLRALEMLENTRDFADLPNLFVTTLNDTNERAYLDDALTISLDQFIQHLSPDERQLLWVIALSNDPVTRVLLNSVWGHLCEGKSQNAALLHRLSSVGLVTETRLNEVDSNPEFSCHELVRERIQNWMDRHPEDRQELDQPSIRIAYAERLVGFFQAMRLENMGLALEAGSRALIYCVQAQAWERLEGFVSSLITSIRNSRDADLLIPYLQIAVDNVLDDQVRLSFLCSLADALATVGRLDISASTYQRAADLGHSLTENGADEGLAAWSSLAVIYCNWAVVHSSYGQFDLARQCYVNSSHAEQKNGSPAINTLINDLQILKLDIKLGHAEQAEPAVTKILDQVRDWWVRHLAGESLSDAPDAETLTRTLIGAYSTAMQIDDAKQDWDASLEKMDIVLRIEQQLARPAEDIGATRFNRANTLMQMPLRLDEARDELESCIKLFQEPNMRAKVLSSLASLAEKQNDLPMAISQERRALALHQQMPDPIGRADSHNNLASRLVMRGTVSDLEEYPRHRLASFIYSLETGQDLSEIMTNLLIDHRNTRSSGNTVPLPRLDDLLRVPEFRALVQWLDQRQVDLDTLQANIDLLVNQLHSIIDRHGLSEEADEDA